MNRPSKNLGKFAFIREINVLRFMHDKNDYVTLTELVSNIDKINYNQVWVALKDLCEIQYIEIGNKENSGKYIINSEGRQYINWRKSAEHLVGY